MTYFKDLNLGIDIDGVLVNNFIPWKAYYGAMEDVHDHKIKNITFSDSPNWDFWLNICGTCWKHVLTDREMILSYQLVDGAKDILTFLHEQGCKLHIISSRPDEAVEYTHNWAKYYLGPILETINVTNNKVETACALNVKYHVDDAPGHIRAFQEQKQVQPIIWNHPYNVTIEGPRVSTWPEYGAYIFWNEHR